MAIYQGRISHIFASAVVLLWICGIGMTKENNSNHCNQIADASQCFLKMWLIDRNVDAALEFIAEEPVMGACLGNPRENLEWRLTRTGVLEKLKPAFSRVADDSPPNVKLEDLISSQETKLDYARIKHLYSTLFDLYPVGPDLLRVVEKGICSGEDKTEFFIKGLHRHSEVYLMLFHFKEGLKVTILWCREGDDLKILSVDFPE